MYVYTQSHLLAIRFAICMNLLLRRAINIKFGHAKFCRKFSGRNTPLLTPTNEILNPLHYKFLVTPLHKIRSVYADNGIYLHEQECICHSVYHEQLPTTQQSCMG